MARYRIAVSTVIEISDDPKEREAAYGTSDLRACMEIERGQALDVILGRAEFAPVDATITEERGE